MVFSSLTFMCIFLPAVFLLYLVLQRPGLRNGLLIAASLIFYAYGEPVYVLLMLFSSLANWGLGLAVGTPDFRRQRRRRQLVALAVVVNLICLGIFKYAWPIVKSLGAMAGRELPLREIALPVGISFYTFQAMSYVIDIYRGETKPQRSFGRVLLFISFFPQLTAGPIIKYHDVETQLARRTITIDGVTTGLRRFCVGLGKKVLISNTMAAVADQVFDAPAGEINIVVAWIGGLAYLIHIYFDFSGYSDMAIGLAKVFGFHYRENFNYPYISTSIQDFWRRWHISLSTWFRDYLYIPLGGNRKGRSRAVTNKLIVFALCGLWHGAAWTFVVWGLIHGFFLLLEEYVPLRKLPKPLGWLYTIIVVTVCFVLFNSKSFDQAAFMITQMFTGFGANPAAMSLASRLLDPLVLVVFAVSIVAATPLAARLIERGRERFSPRLLSTGRLFGYGAALVCFVLCLLALSSGGYNPFIYFRF